MATARRSFLQQAALVPAAAAQTQAPPAKPQPPATPAAPAISYPRVFRGRQLATIAFPLGGVAAGSLSLGGRGQLRDWEIFNRPDKGNTVPYAFPGIWVQIGKNEPIARVLESRLLPPYQGQSGLGSQNAPGLARLQSATFTGEYPFARVDFTDRRLPVKVSLEAFSPFIPHEPDDSGIPATVLRYKVINPNAAPAKVSIAWSIDNPVGFRTVRGAANAITGETRVNEFRTAQPLEGLYMTNPGLASTDPLQGSFTLALTNRGNGRVTHLKGWPKGRWWNSPMLFWDDFSADGALGPEPEDTNRVGALCLERTIAPQASAEFTFILAWHFPNRTPQRCGWRAPKGFENEPIGNWYAKRFPDAWQAAEYLAENLAALEKKTRLFTQAVRESTIPAAVKDAAMANLSTLASTTCFRTADGEFHGFEGVNDQAGCCFGNCTHVWNYETATAFLFPTFARSLREAAFGYSVDDAGAMHFRQMLPDNRERLGFAATDGQMGQIAHAYLDWRLSGDTQWLRRLWPNIKKSLEFSWIQGGWDANKDGVMEGVQHNTYDVEFYGPNPQCGIYYLCGLRAAEEMARACNDNTSAQEYRRLYEAGSKWIDANLFNGEYYVQKVRGFTKDQIAANLRSNMGADDTTKPEYQVGEGCLLDQLVGQYLADIAGLGPLLNPKYIRKSLESILRYNHRATLEEHDSVQRIYAVNDEAALLICDYGKAPRPRIPFPYYAEAWTGLEYMAGAQMIYSGLAPQGIRAFQEARLRHDGERRNPYDEPECGHHYARAMSAWSGMVALGGFLYHGAERSIHLTPRPAANTKCFWSTATAWGTYSVTAGQLIIEALHGSLQCQTCKFEGAGKSKSVRFPEPIVIEAGHPLKLDLTA
ncbi:MAG: GH116 family glycosyl-hydrolase [Bryobacteraceae bacterium]